MAKDFKTEMSRGKNMGLSEDELAFYDALANNESAMRELGDDTCKSTTYSTSQWGGGKSLEQLCDISGTYKFEGDYTNYSGGDLVKVGSKVSEIELIKGEYDSERNIMSYTGSESFRIDYDDPIIPSQSGEVSISGGIAMRRDGLLAYGPISDFRFKNGACSFSVYRGARQGTHIYTKFEGGE